MTDEERGEFEKYRRLWEENTRSQCEYDQCVLLPSCPSICMHISSKLGLPQNDICNECYKHQYKHLYTLHGDSVDFSLKYWRMRLKCLIFAVTKWKTFTCCTNFHEALVNLCALSLVVFVEVRMSFRAFADVYTRLCLDDYFVSADTTKCANHLDHDVRLTKREIENHFPGVASVFQRHNREDLLEDLVKNWLQNLTLKCINTRHSMPLLLRLVHEIIPRSGSTDARMQLRHVVATLVGRNTDTLISASSKEELLRKTYAVRTGPCIDEGFFTLLNEMKPETRSLLDRPLNWLEYCCFFRREVIKDVRHAGHGNQLCQHMKTGVRRYQ